MIRRTLCIVLVCLSSRSIAEGSNRPTREQLRFFETKVRPLLVRRCFKCHSAKKQQGKLRLDARANVIAGGESGPAIVPGKPEESLLIEAVNYASLEMPPDGKLLQKEINVLTGWIKMGAPWPGKSNVRLVVDGEAFQITDEDRRFWSFQPIVRPDVPSTDSAWAGQPIDAFVFRKLKTAGLSPSPPASRRELIRRVYFDLIGLPPTPQQVDAFVADESPGAYEKLIDRLLERPQYGERWGRHWLDLVRYAQTNGYERDGEKPYAWRYRDYVIRAFNEDKPYDRFILEQLAGDELDDPTHDSIIATGFYRLGVWDDEPDDKVLAVWDEIDDVLRTTGETFLGLTIGCARCHSHKFDPIPQADYYRLAAFFRNIAPYGKDQSSTHWELNPDAVYTPLATAEEFAQFKSREGELRSNVAQLKKRIAELGKAKDKSKEKTAAEAELKRLEDDLQYPFTQALSVREPGPSPPKMHLLVRGSPLTEGREVQPRFLTVLSDAPPAIVPPAAGDANPLRRVLRDLGVKQTSGRRLALARWIVGKDNPLTARVMANRLWHYHFGRGLVSTPSDFGWTGLPSSHPKLLDWLAAELRDGGWRLKRMHKQILLSRTYRQSSRANDACAAKIDPNNALLWRHNLRRLDAEVIRDAILTVNGRLNLKAGGRGIFPKLSQGVLATQSRPGSGWGQSSEEEQARRSVYIYIKRTLTVPLMDSFDQPTPDKPAPARATTTIAPQALILLNSTFMDKNAAAFAERVVREAGDERPKQVDRAFRLALLRLPAKQERQLTLEFLERQQAEFQSLGEDDVAVAGRYALTSMCRMLLNLNEFVYVD